MQIYRHSHSTILLHRLKHAHIHTSDDKEITAHSTRGTGKFHLAINIIFSYWKLYPVTFVDRPRPIP